MKKLLLLLALVGMVAVGCTDNSTDDDQNPPTEQPGPIGDEDLSFTNNTNTAPTISHEGGTAKISFTASLSWSVSVYADWLSVSQDEGEAGNGSFVITAEANTTTRERKGVVAIKLSNNKSYEITVTQSFNTDSDDIEFINNTNTAPRMEYGGGTVQISFIAKTDWTVTCYADWLSTSESSGKKGENSFFITAASNPNDKERSGVVAIKTSNNKSYEIKVTQDPNAGIMQLTVAANEVLYTTIFDTQLNLYKESGFGGNLISHSYDAAKGYGSIRFDNYVTSIPSQAFKDCTTLESIYLPEGVTYIAPDALEGCTNLKYIISPNSDNYSMFVYNGEIMAIVPGATNIVIPEGVTTINKENFYQNSKIESVVIPSSVKSIADEAFSGCSNLKSVVVSDGSTPITIGSKSFYNCSALETITLSNRVISIGESAFEGCGILTTITIPNRITKIADSLFKSCHQLRTITIPNSVTSIGKYAFEGCSGLRNPVLPNSVTSIGSGAFTRCFGISEFTISSSITEIGVAVFEECHCKLTVNSKIIEADYEFNNSATWLSESRISELIIGDNITKIGVYALYRCKMLKSLTIGSGVTSIGNSALNDCSSLTSIYCKPTTPPTLSHDFLNLASEFKIYVPAEAINRYRIAKYWRTNYRRIVTDDGSEVMSQNAIEYTSTYGEVVTPYKTDAFGATIASNTYENGKGYIIFINNVTSIGQYAFYRCGTLQSILLPDGISSIGQEAFSQCFDLTSITIPDSVTKIEKQAFSYCNRISSVYCRATTPPALENATFHVAADSNFKIYVPTNSVEAYKSAQYWSDYALYIQGYDF